MINRHPPKGHISRMQSKHDPSDLEISVSPHGGIDEWQWTLSIGNGAPIETGVVKGSRMDGIRAAREERLRLIGNARNPPDDPPQTGPKVVNKSASKPRELFQGQFSNRPTTDMPTTANDHETFPNVALRTMSS